MSGLGFRVKGLGFGVWGLGFRDKGLGFRDLSRRLRLPCEGFQASEHSLRFRVSRCFMVSG